MFEVNMLSERLLGGEKFQAVFTVVISLKMPTINMLKHNTLSAI